MLSTIIFIRIRQQQTLLFHTSLISAIAYTCSLFLGKCGGVTYLLSVYKSVIAFEMKSSLFCVDFN